MDSLLFPFGTRASQPERERREIFVNGSGGGTGGIPNDAEQRERERRGEGNESNAVVRHLAETYRGMLEAAAPEMSPNLRAVLEDTDLAESMGFDADKAARDAALILHIPMSGEGPWRSAVANDVPAEKMKALEREIAERGAAFLRPILADPAQACNVERELRERINRGEFLGTALENRIALKVGPEEQLLSADDQQALETTFRELQNIVHQVSEQDIALLLSGTKESIDSLTEKINPPDLRAQVAHILETNPTDGWAISVALRLPERIADDTQRMRVQQMLVETMNALTKTENFGATKRDESSRSWSEWRRKYLASLEERSKSVREHIDAALERRAIAFLQADQARLEGFVTSLGISADNWDAAKSAEAAPEVEKACLSRYGVSMSGVGKFFADRRQALEDAAADLNPSDPKTFSDRAESLGTLLKDLEAESNRFDASDTEHFLAEMRQEQEEVEQWAWRIATRVREALSLNATQRATLTPLLQKIHNGDPWEALSGLQSQIGKYAETGGDKAQLAQLRIAYPDCITPSHFSPDERDQLETMLELIAERRTSPIRSGTDLAATFEEQRQLAPEMNAIVEGQEETRTRLRRVLGDVISLNADTPVFQTLKLDKRLREKVGLIEGNAIRAAAEANQSTGGEADDREQHEKNAKDLWAKTQTEMKALESVADGIREISANVLEEEFSSDRTEPGFYSYADRRIHVRLGLASAEREPVLRHEKGHAILHLLRSSGLLPFLLISEEKELTQRIGGESDRFWKMLESLSGYYQISRCEDKFRAVAVKEYGSDAAAVEQRVAELRREFLLEEFEIHFAQWKESGKNEAPRTTNEQTEHELFTMREAQRGPEKPKSDASVPKDLNIELAARRRMRIEGDEDGGEDDIPPPETERAKEAPNIKQQIIDTQRLMKIITSFQDAYRNDPEAQPLLAHIAGPVENFKRKIIDVEHRLYEPGNPEADETYIEDVSNLKEAVRQVSELIGEKDNDFKDITRYARETRPLGFLSRIRFLSILDVIQLYKDTVEDFKTIWKRNQQRALQEVGNVLNDALTKAGKKIPIAGDRYFAKLRGYHERRYAGAELESVDKWKKSMERWDSHEIINSTGNSTNLDQIRGGIEMLCDRGEMDWNDEKIWRVLKKKSRLNMPIEACRRDDVLRDIWLRRMVSDIWKDKELFYKWRTNNDSNTNSHKQKFIQTVDQFSNVQGGLSGSLQRQLQLYMNWKEASEHAGHHIPFPDEVKPHLYEQIIEYSIKNGKMTMEQKMYYLVQGVASGLLSIERLRALAGQNGGIINFFPYIEYFYGKNNTLPEIERIAKSLREESTPNNPSAPFKPGVKTTLWLHFNVAREEAVRARLSKGSTRIAETIDHEDIPFFITQMDYSEMDTMADVISGSRQKVTPEGWKNAYVGFNSKFKIFANCALLEKKGLERLSRSDARMLAQNLGAYIYMDNILTGSSRDKDARPMLSEYQMSTQSPSGAPGTVTRQYRDKMCDFIKNLYDSGLLKNIDWASIGVTPDELLPMMRGTYQRKISSDSVRYMKSVVFPKFAAQLEKAIVENADTFKEILAKNEDKFLNEGGSDKLSREKVQELKEKEREQGEL